MAVSLAFACGVQLALSGLFNIMLGLEATRVRVTVGVSVRVRVTESQLPAGKRLSAIKDECDKGECDNRGIIRGIVWYDGESVTIVEVIEDEVRPDMQ